MEKIFHLEYFFQASKAPARNIRKAIYVKPLVITIQIPLFTPLLVVQILDTFNAPDAQTRFISHGNFFFVKYGAAQHRVLRAQHRPVQVHLGDNLPGAGQMHGCVDADLASSIQPIMHSTPLTSARVAILGHW